MKNTESLKKNKKRYIIKKLCIVSVFSIAVLFTVIGKNFYKACETQAENEFMANLIMQGYSFQQAWDEMYEVMKGKSGPYGTGGIDGIDPYSSGKTSSGNTGSSSKTPAHVHSWTESVTKEASCKETGIMTYTCSCGETKEDTIPLVEHTYATISEIPATCISYRSVTFKCSVCEDEYTHEFVEEGYGEHIYIPMDDSIPASCEEPGSTHYVCNICGDDYWEEVPALGHSYTKYTEDKPASCTEDGAKSIHCDNKGCGSIKEGSETVIPAFGHTEDSNHEILSASFWEDGKETISCITCGEIISEEILPATGGILRYVLPGAVGIIIVVLIIVLIANKKRK